MNIGRWFITTKINPDGSRLYVSLFQWITITEPICDLSSDTGNMLNLTITCTALKAFVLQSIFVVILIDHQMMPKINMISLLHYLTYGCAIVMERHYQRASMSLLYIRYAN